MLVMLVKIISIRFFPQIMQPWLTYTFLLQNWRSRNLTSPQRSWSISDSETAQCVLGGALPRYILYTSLWMWCCVSKRSSSSSSSDKEIRTTLKHAAAIWLADCDQYILQGEPRADDTAPLLFSSYFAARGTAHVRNMASVGGAVWSRHALWGWRTWSSSVCTVYQQQKNMTEAGWGWCGWRSGETWDSHQVQVDGG